MDEAQKADLWALADLCTPWCLHVAATLDIAGQIERGTQRVEDLAAAANCDRDALHAVLSHLAGRGVFVEAEAGRFALNEAARDLLHPITRMSLDLEGLGGRMAHAWGTMLEYVRSGEPAYAQVFGRPFFNDLAANPRIAAEFDAMIGPAGHGTPSADFDITGGWRAVSTVIDVGGGTGAMLAEILRAHPHIQGTLVDLPHTAARSVEIFAAAGVTERARAVGQSFFDPLPPGADVYLLRGILNDWPDREAARILSRCATALPPGGRVVVLKSVQPDGAPKDMTIEMVLVGGKPRDVSAFRALAGQAGLEVTAAGQQARGGSRAGYFVVECRRPSATSATAANPTALAKK